MQSVNTVFCLIFPLCVIIHHNHPFWITENQMAGRVGSVLFSPMRFRGSRLTASQSLGSRQPSLLVSTPEHCSEPHCAGWRQWETSSVSVAASPMLGLQGFQHGTPSTAQLIQHTISILSITRRGWFSTPEVPRRGRDLSTC